MKCSVSIFNKGHEPAYTIGDKMAKFEARALATY